MDEKRRRLPDRPGYYWQYVSPAIGWVVVYVEIRSDGTVREWTTGSDEWIDLNRPDHLGQTVDAGELEWVGPIEPPA